jgi:uncharacterized repeat protein (TIGR03843 family)
LTFEETEQELLNSDFSVIGQITSASNVALLLENTSDKNGFKAIYKPKSGIRELWDFPKNDLVEREYASYLLSRESELNLIPPTVIREISDFGEGMVQKWIEDSKIKSVGIFKYDEVPVEFLTVLEANDGQANLVKVAVADSPWLDSLTIFDAIINNSDRKGSHILTDPSGENWAIDHGVTWHLDNKLRTVLWAKAGESLSASAILTMQKIEKGLSESTNLLSNYLSQDEIEQAANRLKQIATTGLFPLPQGDWPAIPWPVF